MKISKESLLDQIIEKKLLMISKYPEQEKRIQLKNKSRTPLFLDTSKFQSFPNINEKLNKFIAEMIKKNSISHDKIIGLPYGGTMFSYGVAHELKMPTLSIRKEGTKNYGTSGEILGIYKR